MTRILTALVLFAAATCCEAAVPTLTSFYPRHFTVVQTNAPTNVIRLNWTPGGSDLPGEVITVVTTNVFGTLNTTNLFVGGTNITSLFSASSDLLTNVVNIVTTNQFSTLNATNFFVGGTNITNLFPVGVTVNATDNYLPVRSNATTFVDSPLYTVGTTNVATDGQIIFGPGTTNVLYRSGIDLIYSYSGSLPSIKVRNGASNEAALRASGNTAVVVGGSSVDLQTGSSSIRWAPQIFSPVGSSGAASAALGYMGGGYYPFTNLNMVGSANIYGFEDITSGSTNYSRLAISHGGTNSAAIYNSKSSGTAGDPRPHRFDLGGTNQFNIGDSWVQIANGITKAQKATITATNGMIVYQTDNTPGFRGYVNGAWVIFSTAADP